MQRTRWLDVISHRFLSRPCWRSQCEMVVQQFSISHAKTMGRTWSLLVVFVAVLSSTGASARSDNPNEALSWAQVTATRLVACYYNESSGIWRNELAWQSGNTLESLANFQSIFASPLHFVFNLTYVKTDMFVGGDCFDDYQWWLLAWLQAYAVEPNVNYLNRAADIYDVVVNKAWDSSQCGGGIRWCPKSNYKNAITNELFLASSMRLHPYAAVLGKSATYYLDWALREWRWFESSGMINAVSLINDGLTYVCRVRS